MVMTLSILSASINAIASEQPRWVSIWKATSVDDSYGLVGIIVPEPIAGELRSLPIVGQMNNKALERSFRAQYARLEFVCTNKTFRGDLRGSMIFDEDEKIRPALKYDISRLSSGGAIILNGKYVTNSWNKYRDVVFTGEPIRQVTNSFMFLEHALDGSREEISIPTLDGLVSISYDTDSYREDNEEQITEFLNGCARTIKEWRN